MGVGPEHPRSDDLPSRHWEKCMQSKPLPPRRSLPRTLWRRLQRWAFTSAAVAICVIAYGYFAPRPPTINYIARFAEHATAVQSPPPGATDAGPLLQSLVTEAHTFADALFTPVRDELQRNAMTADEAISLNTFYFDWELLYFTDGADPRAVALIEEIYEKLAATDYFSRTKSLADARLFTFDERGAAHGLSGFASHGERFRDFVRLQIGRMARSLAAGDEVNYLAAVREAVACVRAVRGQARINEDLVQSSLTSQVISRIKSDIGAGRLSIATHREALQALATMPPIPRPSQVLNGERLHSHMLLQQAMLQARASFWGRVNEGLGFRKKEIKLANAMFDRLEPLVDLPRHERVARGLAPTGLAAIAYGKGIAAGHLGPAIESWREVRDQSTCTSGGELLLLAIELHRATHNGNPPPSLTALVPDILPALPQDPFAKEGTFRYRVLDPSTNPRGHAYILYSVGLDATDNNGRLHPNQVEALGSFRTGEGYDYILTLPNDRTNKDE